MGNDCFTPNKVVTYYDADSECDAFQWRGVGLLRVILVSRQASDGCLDLMKSYTYIIFLGLQFQPNEGFTHNRPLPRVLGRMGETVLHTFYTFLICTLFFMS